MTYEATDKLKLSFQLDKETKEKNGCTLLAPFYNLEISVR